MTARKTKPAMTADEVRYEVRCAQALRMIDMSRHSGGAGSYPLAPAQRGANRVRKPALRRLEAEGLDEYGYPVGATLTAEERAVRVIDDVAYLPRRCVAATRDGFETFDTYIASLAADHEWSHRAPLIREAALEGDADDLRTLAREPWAGWDDTLREGWKALRVSPVLASRLDGAGVIPANLTNIVGVVRSATERDERKRVIADIETALRRACEVDTW